MQLFWFSFFHFQYDFGASLALFEKILVRRKKKRRFSRLSPRSAFSPRALKPRRLQPDAWNAKTVSANHSFLKHTSAMSWTLLVHLIFLFPVLIEPKIDCDLSYFHLTKTNFPREISNTNRTWSRANYIELPNGLQDTPELFCQMFIELHSLSSASQCDLIVVYMSRILSEFRYN